MREHNDFGLEEDFYFKLFGSRAIKMFRFISFSLDFCLMDDAVTMIRRGIKRIKLKRFFGRNIDNDYV